MLDLSERTEWSMHQQPTKLAHPHRVRCAAGGLRVRNPGLLAVVQEAWLCVARATAAHELGDARRHCLRSLELWRVTDARKDGDS
eukprot:CAMPEP_0183342424 /NCGR_PEP_ID=MMETSP0164_2-20130417/8534_1 /TAXON_ID=221442 /ORGANISM="Coccolithus pelagicus ssp braarudi, Strain PLY182g" /LENGTH=84 /DNA_ID=CAMNT_0025513001 /DNA_START=66 /DNA_END=316 /DNA_ORIENTATION=-